MNQEFDNKMMRRALQLARRGYGFTSPNPMVGAVVVNAFGEIVGEGWHRRWGGPHAEVNAIASVSNPQILPECTVYVTLEPCSHYGKTPPCAKLLIDKGVKRVVVGCPDPFKVVSGRGIAMLRNAGIEVRENVLRRECEWLNLKFIFAHTHRRPYVMLKWAQSRDGFIAAPGGEQTAISSPVSQVLMHRERAGFDAIMVGTRTLHTDNPSLTCRLWPNRTLRSAVLDRHGNVPENAKIMLNPETISVKKDISLEEFLNLLYTEHGITSLLVEGGATLHRAFINAELWQEARVEVAPFDLHQGIKAASPPPGLPMQTYQIGNRQILRFLPERNVNRL
ncbi:MAG: bifunctional diaminohydroxyphosphoribosylaminopyrimidine deaminase/5-amino-6-(5-phosphoribosylamino)uracil reductase RibD [Prevotella sp.]|nr:bifunctional diaminohydroxyphosphoribosylaminopyrimidine deaminase/5-amino-6-(5-phosphoribosylamino)uracil reductase RibD [Prevotella sp.]MCM1074250.1 bifunctional diaminohydroxyphosphoribosylaminopyrimidine deaminase/5-amino-6-(5-phosphoribosylamino)uracil reductase RibD [Ruminococcus sp.]